MKFNIYYEQINATCYSLSARDEEEARKVALEQWRKECFPRVRCVEIEDDHDLINEVEE